MTLMAWLWIGLSILGAIILAAVVWQGRLSRSAIVQPFDSALVRLLIILAIFLAVGGAIAWRIISRRRAAPRLPGDDRNGRRRQRRAGSEAKMEDALAVLKRSGKSNARDLPWYLIIGPRAPARPPRSSTLASNFLSRAQCGQKGRRRNPLL